MNTLETIRSDFASPDPVVRDDACYAVVDGRFVELAPLLQKLLASDPDATVRASAAEALGDLGDGAAVDALFEALNDPDRAVRCFAANSLGLLSAPQARLLAPLERETENSVRVNLLVATLRVGGLHVLDALVSEVTAAVREEDDAIRMLNALDDLASRPGAANVRIVAERLSETLLGLRSQISAVDRGQLDTLVGRLRERAKPGA